MKGKLDACLVGLRDPAWGEVLKENVLRTTQRLADQQAKDCASQEFQLLIQRANKSSQVCGDLVALARCAKTIQKNDTEENAKLFSAAMTPILEHLTEMNLNDVHGTLHMWNATWMHIIILLLSNVNSR